MAKVIAIANQKGGVGKTTTCVNLSSCVAALGKKVLVVDLDPQGNTTSGYGVAKKGQQSNIYTCLINDDDIRQAIVHTKFNADLIASNTQLAGAVVELVELPRRENRLRSILAPLIPLYDYVFIDCPPSLGLLTLNALTSADFLIIPVQAQFLAMRGMAKIMNVIATVQERLNPKLAIGGIVITQFDKRKTLNKSVAELVKDSFCEKVFKTVIRDNVSLAEAPIKGKNIFEYSRNSNGAKDYMALAQEVLKLK